MTASDLAAFAQGGGTVALAIVVWHEVREMRRMLAWFLMGGTRPEAAARNGRAPTPPPF